MERGGAGNVIKLYLHLAVSEVPSSGGIVFREITEGDCFVESFLLNKG